MGTTNNRPDEDQAMDRSLAAFAMLIAISNAAIFYVMATLV